jgi:predicted Rdx family selenoprotein
VGNPHVQANYQNFFAWRNMRSGVIGETLGSIKFSNIRAADNLRSGIEISKGNAGPIGELVVDGATIVGRSTENGGSQTEIVSRKIRGLILPQRDNLWVKNVRFEKFED